MGRVVTLFLAFVQSVTLPLHFDDMDAMGESIQQRTGKPLIAEDLWPFTKGEIGGDDQRGAFVALGEKAKEVFCGPLTQGDLAQLVDDNQIAFVDGSFQFLQVTLFPGFRIGGGQSGRGEKPDAIASPLSTRQQEPTTVSELSPLVVEMFEYIV